MPTSACTQTATDSLSILVSSCAIWLQLIDTAWSVALQRAQKAGRLLAHSLAAGAHGNRPVTLVGNSMGARLIFHCLLELARLKAKGKSLTQPIS